MLINAKISNKSQEEEDSKIKGIFFCAMNTELIS